MNKLAPLIFTALLLVALHADEAQPATRLGLEVRDGVLLREGKPYRGIGVNYFNAFGRVLASPTNTTYRAGLATLHEYGIPFARVAASGFWPSDWRLYQNDPAAYFALLDAVVKAAESNQVGLVPSLFWRIETLPELVGEPVSAWGDPASRTHALMRRYTEEVVTRYRYSPAIWGWEFANEMSLSVDLPNAKSQLAARKAIPHLGVPTPTEADILHTPAMLIALREFGKVVRRFDPHRPIISGNSAPRPGAWHNTAENSWSADTREQFMEVLRRDNPDPLSMLSVHWYPEQDKRFAKTQPAARPEVLRAMQEAAQAARKPLFVGEFGVSKQLGPAREKEEFTAMLHDFELAGVPLAAVWVFDLDMQDKDWNITSANERSYMLKAVAEANRCWQQTGREEVSSSAGTVKSREFNVTSRFEAKGNETLSGFYARLSNCVGPVDAPTVVGLRVNGALRRECVTIPVYGAPLNEYTRQNGRIFPPLDVAQEYRIALAVPLALEPGKTLNLEIISSRAMTGGVTAGPQFEGTWNLADMREPFRQTKAAGPVSRIAWSDREVVGIMKNTNVIALIHQKTIQLKDHVTRRTAACLIIAVSMLSSIPSVSVAKTPQVTGTLGKGDYGVMDDTPYYGGFGTGFLHINADGSYGGGEIRSGDLGLQFYGPTFGGPYRFQLHVKDAKVEWNGDLVAGGASGMQVEYVPLFPKCQYTFQHETMPLEVRIGNK
jgi:hypothetical protein